MDMQSSAFAHPKPEARAKSKRRKDRTEAAIKQAVRTACVNRDGFCRVAHLRVGDVRQWANPYANPCESPSEWAHLGKQKRARTRGQDPAVRHTTAGSLMLCRGHHRQYDAGLIA